MNAPDRFELFQLGEGQKKVTWVLDTRVPNTAIFTFEKEDHTLANLLNERLHQSPKVYFAAYIIPHPLESRFEMRVTTDGSIDPRTAIIQAAQEAVRDLEILKQNFTKEMEVKKMAMAGGNKN
ncbi:putative DNA-directed RNA polymerase II subunit RPB11a [Aulographum hederae CBS 113979]|uniref:Putative DNA-directed RNA polymerase II subunit RPB11a n=1 Tax=Aulographum hederae CBS 113979 TaxID=1176131 RepID=A0A6G1H459_9PEZI|nr:putative DNA-directed RNA polymerase II subunit RPB11a [Aulographum hederae CBS 113979]